jgi:hypothetical protein
LGYLKEAFDAIESGKRSLTKVIRLASKKSQRSRSEHDRKDIPDLR